MRSLTKALHIRFRHPGERKSSCEWWRKQKYYSLPPLILYAHPCPWPFKFICQVGGPAVYTQHPCKIIACFDSYQNELLSCMGVEYKQPAHLLDKYYIKGGDIRL